MKNLRIVPVTNGELVYSLCAVTEENVGFTECHFRIGREITVFF